MRKTVTGKQWKTWIALAGVILAGLFSGAVIVSHQRINPPSWVPIVGKQEYTLRAQLDSVQGVLPGQGQAVTISGVHVGQIAGVDLVDGIPVAKLRIEKRYAHFHPDATALLRPKTALKDMVVEVNPGTPAAGPELPSGTLLRTNHTASDVNLDEILASLDKDTRDYLTLLVTDGARALNGRRGRDLAEVFRRFDPLSRHVAEATKLVAQRRTKLKRLVGNLSQLATELGARNRDIATFVRANSAVFARFAAQSADLEQAVELLPSSLDASNTALQKIDGLGRTLRSASTNLDPSAKALAPAFRDLVPFFKQTTPAFKNSIRPFVRDARPATRLLVPATGQLSEATPKLTDLTKVLNSIVNEAAYKSPGKGADSNSFLFYIPWASHNTNSVLANQDGIGPLRRGMILVSCTSLGLLDTLAAPTRNPTLATLIQLLGIPKTEAVCGLKK